MAERYVPYSMSRPPGLTQHHVRVEVVVVKVKRLGVSTGLD